MTPDLSHSGVAGIMRTIILEQASQQGLDCRIARISEALLGQADEVFLSNSLIGIWPANAIGETSYSKGEITQRLQELLSFSSDNDSGWQV